ncbi:MAG: ATP-binding protein [Thermodesulfobacteriota bacterium]
MNRPYANLSRRMTIVALLVALLPLNGLGLGLYYYFHYANTQALMGELRIRAANRAGAIELFLAERTALLEVLASAARLHQLGNEPELSRLLQIMNRRSWSFVDLGIIDASGQHRAYVGPYQLRQQNYRDAPWFQQVMLRGVYLSDVFLGYRQVPHFVIAVKHDDGADSWILRATIDSDVFNRVVRTAQVGKSGDAYIVNRQGLLQTPSRHGGKVLDKAPLNLRSVPPGSSVVSRTTADGRQVITALAWMDHGKWLLVIDQDPKEGLGLLTQAHNIELVVLGLASLFLVAAVLFLVRLFIRQLQANDAERAAIDAQLSHSARLVSLGRMAAGVAHEINNPLAAISELAGEVQDILVPAEAAKLSEGEVVSENLTRIQNQVERARGVTHRMLKFARRMEPHLESLDLNEVVQESYSFIEKEALFQNIKVHLELEPSLPLIKSDRAQLQQVFLNLLDNALDAAGQGGRVRVSTAGEGSWLTVRVHDSGPGVPPELAERVFDPFFTTKQPGQGTGLGLSISHSIMQRLGGRLELEGPTDEGGATFVVRVPNVPPEAL